MADLTDREMLIDLCEMFERAAHKSSRPGGMSVPYHGPFAAVLHYPSVQRDVCDLARRLRDHLDCDTEAPSRGEPSEDDDDDPWTA